MATLVQRTADATTVLAAGLRASQVEIKKKKTTKKQKLKNTTKNLKNYIIQRRSFYFWVTLTNTEKNWGNCLVIHQETFSKQAEKKKHTEKNPTSNFVIQIFTFIPLPVKLYISH